MAALGPRAAQARRQNEEEGHASGGPRRERLDVYEQVTARILEKLAEGTIPWLSPSIARVGFPRNFSTGKHYRGINVFLLSMQQFHSPYFLTFLQAKDLGGHVRKGERGFPVIKVGTWEKKTQELCAPPEENSSTPRHFLRFYTVFNASQIEGIEFPEPPPCPDYTESEKGQAARQIAEGMPNPPDIFEGRKAIPHYVPATDTVELPDRRTFLAEWRFYKTLFHELAHSTGHASRLARKSLTENPGIAASETSGLKTYCEEELVAEMTAAFLGASAGIIEDGFENSAAYLKGWMDVLKVSDHRKWLVRAASEAQKAADYILGIDPLRP